MLRRVEIAQYGLVASAEIAFSPGATIFTGETGSGKTMILGAIGFALGARANADVVRRGATRAVVTLAFDPNERLRERLCADGFEVDDGEEATVVREMSDGGKSSVRVNGRASTASYVRDIAPQIVEVVGQHEAHRLLSPAFHLEMLDRYAGAKGSAARAEVATRYDEWSAATRELAELTGNERKAQSAYDDAKYALEELELLAPQPGEDERLTERRRYLDNVERIGAALRNAHGALAEEDGSASSALGIAASALSAVAELSETLARLASDAAALQSEAGDLATRIARELDATDFDPRELDTINARLDALDRAKRKYGASIDSLLEHEERSRAIVAAFEGKDERIVALTKAVDARRRSLEEAAAALTRLRTATARRLAAAVTAEFADLALASGRFDSAFHPLERASREGAEAMEFLFAANAGEELRPLARVASGGERSRVLLALVVALASGDDDVALVFDEIDAGIGGATASAVGARLGRLAKNGQVISVTHLAQLATWADRHYVLDKREARGSTTIEVREIASDDERASELARMLSGESHAAALEHARALMKAVR